MWSGFYSWDHICYVSHNMMWWTRRNRSFLVWLRSLTHHFIVLFKLDFLKSTKELPMRLHDSLRTLAVRADGNSQLLTGPSHQGRLSVCWRRYEISPEHPNHLHTSVYLRGIDSAHKTKGNISDDFERFPWAVSEGSALRFDKSLRDSISRDWLRLTDSQYVGLRSTLTYLWS